MAIREGLDADPVLVDPAAPWTLTQRQLKSLHPWSPFPGRPFQHRVEQVYRRGQPIFADEQTVAAAGGEWLRAAGRAQGQGHGEQEELPVAVRSRPGRASSGRSEAPAPLPESPQAGRTVWSAGEGASPPLLHRT